MRVGVIVFPGSNCDRDALHGARLAGAEAQLLWHEDTDLHGSDAVALEATAVRAGDEYVLNGEKRWIGNGTIADVVVLWARDGSDGQVKAFLVEKGAPGYDARIIEGILA